jgi:hypothetical protein
MFCVGMYQNAFPELLCQKHRSQSAISPLETGQVISTDPVTGLGIGHDPIRANQKGSWALGWVLERHHTLPLTQ